MTLPTLFKKTNTGAIQTWQIEVEYQLGGGLIRTVHGQLDGKLQETTDLVTTGKNVGRSNQTTALQQAEAEAEAKWTKQLKKGYVDSVEAAQAGEVDEIIEGGLSPMLAPSKIYPTFAHKLTFPVYVQSKLDGTRCIAILKDGKCTLWSRTRKRINSVPHIVAHLETLFPGLTITFDGELYNHELKNDFEELISLIRQDEPGDGHEKIQYHIYDLPSDPGLFKARNEHLKRFYYSDPLVLVQTEQADNHDEVVALHEKNLEAGYEGSMVRGNGPYEGGKRSYYLQKLKNFIDNEFAIIGAEEGRGKDAGTVGAFVCITEDNTEFKARLKATYERRRELFNDPKQWQGKCLTVAYQNMTSDGVPRFPIGKSIRDYD